MARVAGTTIAGATGAGGGGAGLDTQLSINRNSISGLTRAIAGLVSINGGDNTKIDIQAGTGTIYDNTVDPPTKVDVFWPNLIAVTVTNLTTAPFTALCMDATGTLVQSITAVDGASRRDLIHLAVLVHPGLTVVESVINNGIRIGDGPSLTHDIVEALGDTNLFGNVFSANGPNLLVDRSAGRFFGLSIGPVSNPNFVDTVAAIGITNYIYSFRDTDIMDPFNIVARTAIDPVNYDDGSGTLATVPNNDWTIQPLLFEPRTGLHIVEYGQDTYNMSSDALDALAQDGVFENPAFAMVALRGHLVVKKEATDLTTSDAIFVVNSSR